MLDELTESGFITPYTPFDRKFRDSIYKLTDEYSLFFAKFIGQTKEFDKNIWQRISETQFWRTGAPMLLRQFASSISWRSSGYWVLQVPKKTIFPTLITTYGTKKNDYYPGRVMAEVVLESLF